MCSSIPIFAIARHPNNLLREINNFHFGPAPHICDAPNSGSIPCQRFHAKTASYYPSSTLPPPFLIYTNRFIYNYLLRIIKSHDRARAALICNERKFVLGDEFSLWAELIGLKKWDVNGKGPQFMHEKCWNARRQERRKPKRNHNLLCETRGQRLTEIDQHSVWHLNPFYRQVCESPRIDIVQKQIGR